MISFKYPIIDDGYDGNFIGCGLYLASTTLDNSLEYEPADNVNFDIDSVYAAASEVAPESFDNNSFVYQRKGDSIKYCGDSLKLAYFLSLINCSKQIKLKNIFDIWCTGNVELNHKTPVLNSVDPSSFNSKIEAFVYSKDKLFIVPASNMKHSTYNYLKKHNIKLLTIKDIHNELTQKSILIVQKFELEKLVKTIFCIGYLYDMMAKIKQVFANLNPTKSIGGDERQRSDPQKSWILPIITLIIAAFGVIAVYVPFFAKQPQFSIANSVLKSDAKLVIRARNKKANQDKQLDVIFDGCSFLNSGILDKENPKNKFYQWHFEIKKYTNADKLIKDGEHKIKVCFPGEKYSEEFNILFLSTSPIVRVEKTNKSGKTIVKGEVTTEVQVPKNILSVYISYYQEGKEYSIDNIPLTTKIHKETGITYFEFETVLQGLPDIKSDDPNFSKKFWSIKVIDQAGNDYYYDQSYAKFIAPGSENFGVGSIANIKIEKLSEDVSKQLKNIVRIIPQKNIINKLPNGKAPIDLTVNSIGDNAAKLEWTYNITSIEPFTIVYKNEKKIGASISNEYIDSSVNNETKYRVEQVTDQFIYSSEVTKFDPPNNSQFIEIEDFNNNEIPEAYPIDGRPPGGIPGNDISVKLDTTYDGIKSIISGNSSQVLTNATLTVHSNIKNCIVYIDDNKYGSTPIDIDLPFGRYEVKIEKIDFMPFITKIVINRNTLIKGELLNNLEQYIILVSLPKIDIISLSLKKIIESIINAKKEQGSLKAITELTNARNEYFYHIKNALKNCPIRTKNEHLIDIRKCSEIKKRILKKINTINLHDYCSAKVAHERLLLINKNKENNKLKWNNKKNCDYTILVGKREWKIITKGNDKLIWIPLGCFSLE